MLDYPVVVIYHENIHKFVFDDEARKRDAHVAKTYAFEKGKSCLFKASAGTKKKKKGIEQEIKESWERK